MKKVQGYEFDDACEFNDDAVYILALLRRIGAVYFGIQDFSDETIRQLMFAEKAGHFKVFQQESEVWIIESGRFEIEI